MSPPARNTHDFAYDSDAGVVVSFGGHDGVVFFDDTCPHSVRNDTDEERVVLFFDFTRPMKRAGRWVHRPMMLALKRTNFFRDGLRNQRAWEARHRELLEREAP